MPQNLVADCKLDYEVFLEVIACYEAAERDDIPRETIQTWYIALVRKNWTTKQFIQRINEILSADKQRYGKLKLSEILNGNIDNVPADAKIKNEIDRQMRVLNRKIAEMRESIELTDREKDLALLQAARNEKENLERAYKEIRENAVEAHRETFRTQADTLCALVKESPKLARFCELYGKWYGQLDSQMRDRLKKHPNEAKYFIPPDDFGKMIKHLYGDQP